jgi:maltooligosyltrehalose trehalohydrolase
VTAKSVRVDTNMSLTSQRRLSSGIEIQIDGGAHARVWAPARKSVEVVLDSNRARNWRLAPQEDGYFAGELPGIRAGDRYWLRLDGLTLRPDPASRYQPEGPHGPSMVVNPAAFQWTDVDWKGVDRQGQVLYEMHVGTYTPQGTWQAAAAQLDALADLGITVIEMMPVADFVGRFGWGYDGVNFYAPSRLYGGPDDLRSFVDRAHAVGLGVILDVVYNHVGPDGNYLQDFSPDYFTDRYKNDWGRALNFEGPRGAREFFIDNAVYWIEEFHFDGLRLDATQEVHDQSAEHVIASIVRRSREASRGRSLFIVAENESQDTTIVRPAASGGYGADALWNEDYHHTAAVALTGKREAYYLDYCGSPQELLSCAKYGYLYQGQWSHRQKQRRGTPALDLLPDTFIAYLENHDQVANTAFGRRLHQSGAHARLRALTALTLLGPATPLLFQGQDFAASSPFLFFADHKEELHSAISAGRREFLSQFPSVTDPEVLARLPRPGEQAFERSKLDLGERERHREWYDFHHDLLHLRRTDPVIRRAGQHRPDGAVIASSAFILRYQGGSDGDRLLVVNLGRDLDLKPLPEPLLAAPPGSRWDLEWSSESPRYGGSGTPPLRPHSHWHVPAESAVLLRSAPGPINDDDGEEGP